ncbi:unannotated protein [freshwater metagenome]|uniref:Unannotated protein n=1 Tax=freshwater metagenome TaxID=449393 RepID=A0A6J6E699_9ZZZZ
MKESRGNSDVASVRQRFTHALDVTSKTKCFLHNDNTAVHIATRSRDEDVHRPVGCVELLLLGDMSGHAFPLRDDAIQRRSDGDGR